MNNQKGIYGLIKGLFPPFSFLSTKGLSNCSAISLLFLLARARAGQPVVMIQLECYRILEFDTLIEPITKEYTMNKGLFTSARDDWETPQDLFDQLDRQFHFVLDPCSTDGNAKCRHHFTKKDDGLSKDWLKYGSVFCNPPYGRAIGDWLKKANETAAEGATVVCLVPARTDTVWWHSYCQDSRFNHIDDEIGLGVKKTVRFLKGRLKFDGKNPAPFPSAVVILQPEIPMAGYNDWLIENKKKWQSR